VPLGDLAAKGGGERLETSALESISDLALPER
jgi:hypothetical protein